jgi:hypothetical protein
VSVITVLIFAIVGGVWWLFCFHPKQSTQKNFKESVTKIDTTVCDSLKNVVDLDTMNLDNNIAMKSDSTVNNLKEKNTTETPKRTAPEKENTHSPQENLPTQSPPVPPTQSTADTDKTKKIRQYLQGSELKKDSLEKYKKDANASLKTSIDLCLEFWELVKKNNQKDDYNNLLKKIKKDTTLQTSKLKAFLDGICASSDAFAPHYNLTGKRTIETLNELKNKIQK